MALLLAGAVGLRLAAITSKTGLVHDEGISYLAAAGKQGLYKLHLAQEHPAGKWVPARRWKDFFEIEDPFCLGRIRRDLVAVDLHPPLYFWILHLAALGGRITPRLGPLVNVGLHVLSFLALAALAWRVTRDGLSTLLVVALWSLSGSVLSTTYIARQYELLALTTISSALCLSLIMDSPRDKGAYYGGLALSCLAGLLTHYQFLFPLALWAALAGLAGWAGWLTPRRRYLKILAALLAAAGLFLLIQPEFLFHLGKADYAGQPASLALLGQRAEVVGRTIRTFLGALLPPWPGWWPAALAGLGLAAELAVLGGRWRRGRPEAGSALLVLAAALALGLLTVGQYLSFRAPRHAMGDRYLAVVWPFLAFLPVLGLKLALTARPRWLKPALATVLVWVVIHGALNFRQSPYLVSDGIGGLADYPVVVFDNIQRGVFPGVFIHLQDETLVCAAPVEDLLAFRGWLAGLEGRDRVALVTNGYLSEDYPAKRAALLALVAERHQVTLRPQVWPGLYEITPRP